VKELYQQQQQQELSYRTFSLARRKKVVRCDSHTEYTSYLMWTLNVKYA